MNRSINHGEEVELVNPHGINIKLISKGGLTISKQIPKQTPIKLKIRVERTHS